MFVLTSLKAEREASAGRQVGPDGSPANLTMVWRNSRPAEAEPVPPAASSSE